MLFMINYDHNNLEIVSYANDKTNIIDISSTTILLPLY